MPKPAQISIPHSVVPASEPDVSQMADGELALNRASGRLYFKNSFGDLDYFVRFSTIETIVSDLIDDSIVDENTAWSSNKIQDELNDKSDVGHTHNIGDVNDLQSELDSKAEINDAATNSNETWSSQQITDHVTTETASCLLEAHQTEINNATFASNHGYHITGADNGRETWQAFIHAFVRSPFTMSISHFTIYCDGDMNFTFVNDPGGRFVYVLRFWIHDNPYARWDWGRNGNAAQREVIYPGAFDPPYRTPSNLPTGVEYIEREHIEDLRNVDLLTNDTIIRAPTWILDTSNDPVIFPKNKVVMARFRIYRLDENDNIQPHSVGSNEHIIKAHGRYLVN